MQRSNISRMKPQLLSQVLCSFIISNGCSTVSAKLICLNDWKKLQEASGDTGDLQYSELEETDRGPHTNSYPFLSAIDLICWTNVMIPDSPGIHKTLSTVHSPHLLSILRRQYPNQLFSFPLYNAYNT
ncbi:uncharacterized protein [Macrobrachium rosenbergii]|uniref:uncharacterized protein isoform X2 n=1 Tax=Macrobrachium rosenbergii TaxID=79674 RepID=UPI0034D565C5